MSRVNKLILLLISPFLMIMSVSSYAERPHLTGAGVQSFVATGYGLYAVTMRANGSPGSISSFYLYSQSGTYPSRWHEVDIEFTPGFTSKGYTVDASHPKTMVTGNCYQKAGDNLPSKSNCLVKSFDSLPVGTKAGSIISFNSFNHRAIDGYPYEHSDAPAFMPAMSGDDIFKNYHTYYFYYTPKGIYWTKDLPAEKLTESAPRSLPVPVFVKKDFNTVNKNTDWENNLAFSYDGTPLNPKLSSGELAQTGALMKISMNLWDGSNTDPQHVQDWGGEYNPTAGSSSSYQYVAFYPLQTPVKEVGSDPTKLQYGNAKIYSDFTTPEGEFKVDGKETTFANLWQVYNEAYLWPLGQLDERNISCGHGSFDLKISRNYNDDVGHYRPRQSYEPVKICEWLNQN